MRANRDCLFDAERGVSARPRCRCTTCRAVRERGKLGRRQQVAWEGEVVADIIERIAVQLSCGSARRPSPEALEEHIRLIETWPAVWFRRGFPDGLRMGAATFPRYAGELFSLGPFTAVELRHLRHETQSGYQTFTNIPEVVLPWLRNRRWTNLGEARFDISEACVAFGRAERDKYWADQK